MPLNKFEFLENRWSKGFTLCNLEKTFYMYFLQLPECWWNSEKEMSTKEYLATVSVVAIGAFVAALSLEA